jgi:polysaccharide deacetylase family protein (PEP-CTERM system associated)
MYNALTIDLEDYYHVQAFANVISPRQWGAFEPRIQNNTRILLDLLDLHAVTCTFFVLGWVAQRFPLLVREISDRGHEIASHGMNHILVYTQSEKAFREETRDSRAILEDICQEDVIGYRAATYSITHASMWAIDILCDIGFKYDSSIFPVRHDHYGVPDAYPFPSRLRTASGCEITEFPISVLIYGNLKLPVSGGGYFRLLPYVVTQRALRHINTLGNEFVFYLHPWEIDPEQPRIRNAGLLSQFRHYCNLSKTYGRLQRLLKDFAFTTMRHVLSTKGLL